MRGILVLLAAHLAVGALAGADRFKITTKRADDAVAVQDDKDKTVFDVKSPFGISRAVIERVDDGWPKAVVLRLHLRGLENFRASNGKVTLSATAGVRDGKSEAREWKDGKEDAPLDADCPFWMDVRVLDGDGKPAKDVPLKDGCFEITLPRAFFADDPKSITLEWIDFYRE